MNPARAARVDLSGVSNEEATEALTRMAGAIEKEVRRVGNIRLSGADIDDLRAIGRLAVLEALVTYTEHRGRTFDSWAYQVLRWRLHEAVQAGHALYQIETCRDNLGEVLSDNVADVPTPEDLCIRQERLWRMEQEIAQLPPRSGLALVFKLRGESLAEIGASVGVHSSLVCREIKHAVATIAASLREDAAEVEEEVEDVA